MTKTRFLALVTALALLLAIPTAAFAQNARPHVFVGTVALDGAPAVDGAAVTAWVDGEQVAATNASGGQYVLQVESTTGYAGKTVSFKVSGANASQTIVWEEGGGDILYLTATTGSGSGPGGDPGSRGPAGPAGAPGVTGARAGTAPAGASGPARFAGSAGPRRPCGATGSAGSAGSAGTAGAAGDDGGGALALIALIVAIVALLAAGGSYMMGRRA